MGSSSKVGSGARRKKLLLSDHAFTVQNRLHEALSLGIRVCDNKSKRWQCSDAEIQSHVLRTMADFIASVSPPVLQLPLVKDTISDTLVALEGIILSGNERILKLAADTILKLVSTLGSSICQYDILGVANSLSCLLSTTKLQVANSCAIVLNRILVNLATRGRGSDKEIWKVIEDSKIVGSVAFALQSFVDEVQPAEYFIKMASLLEMILSRWPSYRYGVWKNKKLMAKLADCCSYPNSSITAATLQLFSALALCGNVTMELLEDKGLVSVIVQCTARSQPCYVQVEALRVCRHLMRSARCCNMLTSLHCESIAQGILSVLGQLRPSCSRNVPHDQMPMVKEACSVAFITRWAGDHHSYFWKLGMDKILFDYLLGDCAVINRSVKVTADEELVAKLCESNSDLRPYLWDILGWLAIHCKDEFLPKNEGRLCYLKILISLACSVATDLINKRKGSLSPYKSEAEPISRAVLLMVLSPCKYISSHARQFLSAILSPPVVDDYVEHLLASLNLKVAGNVPLMSESLQTVIDVVSLGCYSTSPDYQKLIFEKRGIEILAAMVKRCIDSDIKVSRSSISPHLHSIFNEKTCCWSHVREWEGEDLLLFHCLQSLSQLICFSNVVSDHLLTDRVHCIPHTDSEVLSSLVDSLQHILSNNFSAGPRWYAAYALSFFSFYGFPSKLGKRMERALEENELADLQLILSNGQLLRVHSVILMARCPFLLPPEEPPLDQTTFGDGSPEGQEFEHNKSMRKREVRISERVDYVALRKILEYAYSGFILVEENFVKPLKILVKCCGFKTLSCLLHRRLPRWGADVPVCDLTQALEPTCQSFSDIILEAKEAAGVAWNCSICQSATPHMHAHKIILWFSCDYLRALFRSGMHESYSDVIKVPIGWNALVKLMKWMYSGELPRINPGCAWKNMDAEQQLVELQAYVELSSLAEFWVLDEVQEESLNEVIPLLKADQQISLKIISTAASLNQWKIVEVAVSCIAPAYPKMRDSGKLENFDDVVVDMLRSEYVRYSHGVHG